MSNAADFTLSFSVIGTTRRKKISQYPEYSNHPIKELTVEDARRFYSKSCRIQTRLDTGSGVCSKTDHTADRPQRVPRIQRTGAASRSFWPKSNGIRICELKSPPETSLEPK